MNQHVIGVRIGHPDQTSSFLHSPWSLNLSYELEIEAGEESAPSCVEDLIQVFSPPQSFVLSVASLCS